MGYFNQEGEAMQQIIKELEQQMKPGTDDYTAGINDGLLIAIRTIENFKICPRNAHEPGDKPKDKKTRKNTKK